jgi:hypothetical protein
MNKLPQEKQVEVVKLLCEGMSMRAVTRVTGVAKQTVANLLVDLGAACASYQYRTLRNLSCKRVEADEQWSFVYAKAKNVPEKFMGEFGKGDVWVWKAICVDLGSRLTGRIQLTTDGHKPYLEAVEAEFGADVDYAMLIKTYGGGAGSDAPANVRYSPGHCTGIEKRIVVGTPDEGLVSTSYIERQNLTTRMQNRRFTRLTNGFSKKVANHEAMLALHFMHYNFCRIHQSLRVTPAMEAGVASHPWDVSEMVALLDSEPLVNLVNAESSN